MDDCNCRCIHWPERRAALRLCPDPCRSSRCAGIDGSAAERSQGILVSGDLCCQYGGGLWSVPGASAWDSSSTALEILKAHQPISEVLSKIAPFPAGAFGLGRTWLPGDSNTTGLWIIGGFVLLGCLIVAARYALKALRSPQRAEFDMRLLFLVITGLTTITICAVLIYLSTQQVPNSRWKFAQEMRYYSPIFGFLVVILFTGLFKTRESSLVFRGFIALLIGVGAVIVLSEEQNNWRIRMSSPPLGITIGDLERSSASWAFVSEIYQLRAENHAVAFIDDTNNNWYKAWAALAGASVNHSIHPSTLSENINVTQPTMIVALVSHDHSDPSFRS